MDQLHRRTAGRGESATDTPLRDGDQMAHTSGTSSRHYKLEFSTGPFQHTLKVALLLFPVLPSVLALSGSTAPLIIFCGAIVTYMLDYATARTGALMSIWATIACLWFSVYFHNVSLLLVSFANIFMVVVTTWYLIVVGSFVTLHFKWLQLKMPEVIIMLERIVLAMAPISALPLLFTGLLSMVGASHTAVLYAVACGLTSLLFGAPLQSSWKKSLTPNSMRDAYVLAPATAGILHMYFVLSPPLVSIALSHRVMAFSTLRGLTPSVVAICDALLCLSIGSAPSLAAPKRYLWWALATPGGDTLASVLDTVRVPFGIAFAFAATSVLQLRLVFGRYAHLFNGFPVPLNFVALSCGFYSGVIVLVMLGGMLGESGKVTTQGPMQGRWVMLLLLSMVSVGCLTAVLDFPQFMIVTAMVGAANFVSFLLDRKSTLSLVLAGFCFCLLLAWWGYSTFGLLALNLHFLSGTSSIAVDSVVLFGLVLAEAGVLAFLLVLTVGPSDKGTRTVIGIIIVAYCFLFSFLEHVLYSQPEDDIYPYGLMLASSALMVYLAWCLLRNSKVTVQWCAAIMAVALSKIVVFAADISATDRMEIVDDVEDATALRYQHLWYATEIVCLGLSTFVASTCMIMLCIEKALELRRRTFGPLGATFLVTSAVAVFFARDNLIAVIGAVVSNSSGMNRRSGALSAPAVFGLSLSLWGCLLFALLAVHPGNKLFRKTGTAAVLLGAVIVGGSLLLPALSISNATAEDMVPSRITSLPGWCFASSVGFVLLSLAGVIPLPAAGSARMIIWIALGVASGYSLGSLFIPQYFLLGMILIASVVLFFALLLDFAHYPPPRLSASGTPPAVMACICFHASCIILLCVLTLEVGVDDTRMSHVGYIAAEANRLAFVLASSIIFCTNLTLAVVLRLRVTGTPIIGPKRVPASAADDGIVSMMVNISATFALFAICGLNLVLADANVVVVVLSSSLVLLLLKDPYVLNDLTNDYVRYLMALTYVDTILAALLLTALHASYLTGTFFADFFHFLFVIPSHIAAFLMLSEAADPSSSSLVSSRSSPTTVAVLVITAAVGLLSRVIIIRWTAAVGLFATLVRVLPFNIMGELLV